MRNRKGGAGKWDRQAGGGRGMTVRVKTAKGRRLSSKLWLERQLNDPYVEQAKRLGYRSRAAFKLLQLDDKFHLLTRGQRVVDLGAAPGGWSQVAARRVGADVGQGLVIAVDVTEFEPQRGVETIQGDMRDEPVMERIAALLRDGAGFNPGPVDVVLSDMAAASTGHASTDHLRIVSLCEAALDFAESVLAPSGAFVAKVFRGGAEGELLTRLRRRFATVKHFKPAASRSGSAEQYAVAIGYRDAPAHTKRRLTI